MLLIAAVLLLPLIGCAPSLPLPLLGRAAVEDPSKGMLEDMAELTRCLRKCYGLASMEPVEGAEDCLRKVQSRTLWDGETQTWTYEGPTCGAYTTTVFAFPDMVLHLPSVSKEILEESVEEALNSGDAYTGCARACVDEKTARTCEKKSQNGNVEYGLISKGEDDGIQWASLNMCEYTWTMVTTWQEGIPIILFDKETILNLTIVDGEEQAVQLPNKKKKEGKEEESKENDEKADEDKEQEMEKMGEAILCARRCFGEEPGVTRMELRAVKEGVETDGGWYSRYTFDGPHAYFTTLITHDASTRIKLGDGEIEELPEAHVNEEIAGCLAECYADEDFNSFAQYCSESSVYPAWSLVDGGISEEPNKYAHLTVAIPTEQWGCHSLSTFVITERRDFAPIRIVSGGVEEVFSIENERAISYTLHTANTSLLNIDQSN